MLSFNKFTLCCKGKFVSEYNCQLIKHPEYKSVIPEINIIELRLRLSPQINSFECINWLEYIPAQKVIQIAKK